MTKFTVQGVIDEAVADYRRAEDKGGAGAEVAEAYWDALSAGMKSAVGRRVASCMGAEWVARQVDPFNKFLAFVEVCVSGSPVAFLVRTPAPVLATAAALAGFASWAADRMGTVPPAIAGGSREAAELIVDRDKLAQTPFNSPEVDVEAVRIALTTPGPAEAEELADDAITSAVAAYRFGLLRAVEDHWLMAPLPVQAAICRRIAEAMGRTWRHGDGSLGRFVAWISACSEGSRVSFAPPAPVPTFRLIPRPTPARQVDLPWFEDAGRDEPPPAPVVAPTPTAPPEPPLFVTGILGTSYTIRPVPIHPAIGSHAFEVRRVDRAVGHHVHRDLWGMPVCECGDATFRADRTCKHVARLIELGMMPLAASAPLQPFARRTLNSDQGAPARRFEPSAAEMAEARALIGS